ncbi:MAG: DinB family protein [bacterium]|nr:DinB family protein [bacterium]
MSALVSPNSEMSERRFIEYILAYTMDPIIKTFRAIPDQWLCRRPHPYINAPGWIFGHIAVTERKHVGLFLENMDDIPHRFRLFHSGSRPSEAEIAAAIESKEQLIAYWRGVRQMTLRYLDGITDDDLAGVSSSAWLGSNDPNLENPRREWFVMTVQHQNYHWGQLDVIREMFTKDGGRL